jgi:hypothetical protein
VEDDTRVGLVQLHAQEKGGITYVLHFELFLHLGSEEERVAPNDNEVFDVRKNPEGGWALTPENTRIRYQRGEANGVEKCTEAAIPSKGGLFKTIDGLNQAKNYPLIRKVASRGKHEDFFLKIAGQEGALDVELMNEQVFFACKGEQEPKG